MKSHQGTLDGKILERVLDVLADVGSDRSREMCSHINMSHYVRMMSTRKKRGNSYQTEWTATSRWRAVLSSSLKNMRAALTVLRDM